jgi:hypothetical protein
MKFENWSDIKPGSILIVEPPLFDWESNRQTRMRIYLGMKEEQTATGLIERPWATVSVLLDILKKSYYHHLAHTR